MHIPEIINCHQCQNEPTKAATPKIPNITIMVIDCDLSEDILPIISHNFRVFLFIAQTK